jgi:peptide/nickel transport system substrate-binding protein
MARVMIRHVPEAGTQRLLLERGDTDIAFNLISQDVEALRSVPGVKVQEYPSRRIQYFGFNTAVKPFDDPRVREAMKYLIDYDGLAATTMKGLGTVHQTFIPTGWLGSLNEKPFKLDIDRAKALLKEAGLPDGFSFRLLAYNRMPEIDLATAFQATAAKAGVKIEVVTMPGSQVIPLYRDRKLDALLLSYYGPYADPHATASKFAFNPAALPEADPNAKWPSELTWRLGWAPKDLTQMVADASKELDEKRRVERYHEIQRLYWKTSPFAQIFQATAALGMRDNVKGYQSGTRGPGYYSGERLQELSGPVAAAVTQSGRLGRRATRTVRTVAVRLLEVLGTLLGLLIVTFAIGRLVPIDPVLAVTGAGHLSGNVRQGRPRDGARPIPHRAVPDLHLCGADARLRAIHVDPLPCH